MKQLTLILAMLSIFQIGYSQFDRLEVEEIDNQGLVEGRTFRIYAVMKNEGDQLHAVFGVPGNPLRIESTKPFYQNPFGGAMASYVNRNLVKEKPELAYDSWVTVGYSDNIDNQVKGWVIDFSDFEEGKALIAEDAAWFVTPEDEQAFANKSKRILIAQLTTEGVITGTLNFQGRTGSNNLDRVGNPLWETWQVEGIQFTCGDRRKK